MFRRMLCMVLCCLVILGYGAVSSMAVASADRLRSLMSRCKDDPARFIWSVLGCTGERALWSKQLEICESVKNYHTTVVVTGNGVGKSYLGGRLATWAVMREPGSIVFTSAPSQSQLEGVLWKEVRRAVKDSLIPLGGKIVGKAPIKFEMDDDWFAYGHVSNVVEAMSGHHAKDLIVIIDEASGVKAPVFEATDSLNPSKRILLGNPLRPSGQFYDLAQQADDGNRLVNKIVIPSLESPDIHLARSPRGMADATWLDSVRANYGENSLWWVSHVLARFPSESDDSLLVSAWLDLCGRILATPAGHRRIAVDLGLGVGGGDNTVVLGRDDGAILDLQYSRAWSLEMAAAEVRTMADRLDVSPKRISWDAASIGADFANRLKAVGLVGCQPYLGGASGGNVGGNLRSAAAWAMRRRLDPQRMQASSPGSSIMVPQRVFSIPPAYLKLLRPELRELRYGLNDLGLVTLEPKALMMARLKHSPDFADTLIQSFAYVH